jgi:hypothetical protein
MHRYHGGVEAQKKEMNDIGNEVYNDLKESGYEDIVKDMKAVLDYFQKEFADDERFHTEEHKAVGECLVIMHDLARVGLAQLAYMQAIAAEREFIRGS